MVYYSTDNKKLRNILFSAHEELSCDEVNILSGYVGFDTLRDFAKITADSNIKFDFIYGMSDENPDTKKHQNLFQLDNDITNFSIYYPKKKYKSHSKIYIWKYKGVIKKILVGSSNFSETTTINYREILIEPSKDQYSKLYKYYNLIFENSFHCSSTIVKENFSKIPYFSWNNGKLTEKYDNTQRDSFFDKTINNIEQFTEWETDSLFAEKSRINWGWQNGHTDKERRSAYISLPSAKILPNYIKMFPPKFRDRGLGYSDNDPINITWDDGYEMTGIMQGSRWPAFSGGPQLNAQKIKTGIKHPHYITTFQDNKIMGDYLRYRMGIKPGIKVEKSMFKDYGRETLTIKYLSPTEYYMDFASPKMK